MENSEIAEIYLIERIRRFDEQIATSVKALFDENRELRHQLGELKRKFCKGFCSECSHSEMTGASASLKLYKCLKKNFQFADDRWEKYSDSDCDSFDRKNGVSI